MESYYAGVYWPARAESAERCARRAATFFQLLAECDPCFSRWFEKARSIKKALELQFEPTEETFLQFFSKKKYQSGGGGYYFGAWTGDTVQGRGGSVLFFCGNDAPPQLNSCVLHLPYEEPDASRVLTAPKVAQVLRAMTLAWEPEYGLVTPDDFGRAQTENPAADTFLGWATYFSRRRGPVPPLPEPVRVEPVEDLGNLVLLSPEQVSASNPEHLALTARVRQVLAPTGLLAPVSP